MIRIQRPSDGFTLIELLVAVAIISVVLGIGLTALAASIRSSTKASILNQVKQNGDFAIETMTRSVRSAVDVCTTTSPKQIVLYSSRVSCAAPPSNVRLTRIECTEGTAIANGELRKYEDDGMGGVTSTQIVSSVKVSSCTFTASNTLPKRVIINFTLQQDVAKGNTVDVSTQIPFSTEITLRSF